MMVSVLLAKGTVTYVGVGPAKVMRIDLFSVVHSVKTRTLTMTFWWTGRVSKSNTTELLVRVMNSMTF